MDRYKLISAYLAVTAALILSGGCAHGAAELQKTCIEPKTEPMLPICQDGESSCDARIRFVRKSIASTVVVVAYLRTPEEGLITHTGTGTVIAVRGRKFVVTDKHVIDDALLISVIPRSLSEDGLTLTLGKGIPVRVMSAVARMDAALLEPRFDDELPAAMPVMSGRPEAGEMLWHFGEKSHWREGPLLSDSSSCGNWSDVLETDMYCNSGDSGGALVTSTGKLAGVLLGGESDSIGVSGPSFFSPAAETIAALLDAMHAKK